MMKPTRLLLGITTLTALALAGCANNNSGSSGPGVKVIAKVLSEGATVETEQALVMAVNENNGASNFCFLLGTYPAGGPPASATNATGEVTVNAGFGYFTGTRPRAKGKRSRFWTDSTTVILQIDGDTDRIFLMSNSTIHVATLDGSSPEVSTSTSDSYYEVTPGATGMGSQILGPFALASAPAEIRNFVTAAQLTGKFGCADVPASNNGGGEADSRSSTKGKGGGPTLDP